MYGSIVADLIKLHQDSLLTDKKLEELNGPSKTFLNGNFIDLTSSSSNTFNPSNQGTEGLSSQNSFTNSNESSFTSSTLTNHQSSNESNLEIPTVNGLYKNEMIQKFNQYLILSNKKDFSDCLNIHCRKELKGYEKLFCDKCYKYYISQNTLRGLDKPILIVKSRQEFRMEMLNKFKEHLLPIHNDKNCLNQYCSEFLVYREKHFCKYCLDHYKETGKLRILNNQPLGKEENSSSTSTIVKRSRKRIKYKHEMFEKLGMNFDPNISSLNCLNGYCGKVLKSNEKQFCRSCCIFYRTKGKIRGRDKVTRIVTKATRISPIQLETKLKYKNEMIEKFKENLDLDSNSSNCINKYCRDPLNLGEDQFCKTCFKHYRKKKRLRGKLASIRKRRKSLTDSSTLSRIQNSIQSDSTGTGEQSSCSSNSNAVATEESNLNQEENSSLSTPSTKDNSSYMIKMLELFTKELVPDLDYQNCRNPYCSS